MKNSLNKIRQLFVEAGLQVFEDNPTPDWLKNHPAIQQQKELKKVFPSFGLSNFKEKVKLQGIVKEDKSVVISNLIEQVYDQLEKVYQNLNLVWSDLPEDDPVLNKIMASYINLLERTKQTVNNIEPIIKDDKISLKLESDIELVGKSIFKHTDTIFVVFDRINKLMEQLIKNYPKVNTFGWDLLLPKIESLPAVKEFNKSNLPNKEYYIVFSGTGNQGGWDIATMSMRGINSCQNWGDAKFRSCLIGSILSKYVGIIYLTSGSEFENLGTKMIKRCIVRFGVNTNTKKPVIILDKMYDSYDPVIAEMFMDALGKRTSLKILNYAGKNITEEIDDIKIPGEKTLQNLKPDEQPYKDLPILTQQPTSIKENLTHTELIEKFMILRSEIFHQANNSAGNLKYSVYYENRANISELIEISMDTMYYLNSNLTNLINKISDHRLGGDFAYRYIAKKMQQVISSLKYLDTKTIMNKLGYKKSDVSSEDFKDVFDNSVRIYNSIFNKLFNPTD